MNRRENMLLSEKAVFCIFYLSIDRILHECYSRRLKTSIKLETTLYSMVIDGGKLFLHVPKNLEDNNISPNVI